MKKRWRSILTALLLLLPLTAMPVSADVGPKPSVVVALEGLEGRTCWGTLLSQQEGTGPYGRFYEEEAAEDPEEDRALRALLPLERMDSEGFHLLNFVKDCSDGEFSWTYYPPHTYKIALWFPEEDALAVSGVYHRYAFDSYYRLDLSGVELMPGGIVELEAARLQRDYPYGASLLALAGRVALTLGAELLLALAFGLRTRQALKWVAVVNLATQLGLNLALELFTYCNGALEGMMAILALPVYLAAEAVVTLVELRIYRRKLLGERGASGRRITAYTWTANLCSLLAGVLLSFRLPALF
ncbi:MAG: hypothetical protein ACLRIN_03535 [Lawsonibacter sp.]|jgi:hypothetical protein|nr:hypothetical protein [Oscillospiraceae bacterium]